MKTAIINYGMGNLGSVRRAIEEIGAEVFIAEYPDALREATRIILPGVGAFPDGMDRLRADGWESTLRKLVLEEGRPLLGICLGMQMLASCGEEGGETPGLGLVPGRVRRLDTFGCELRIPHIGWNEVEFSDGSDLFSQIPQGTDFYFVHSYAFEAERSGDVVAWTDYGGRIPAAVRSGNVFGTQFHPEKSSKAGRRLLLNFLEVASC